MQRQPTAHEPEATPTDVQRPRRGVRDYAGLVARGFAMGSADIVPGVSGGTMAFITGIYEELIQSIREFTQPPFIRAVTRLRIKEIFQIANWQFLLAVASGIFLAIIMLAPGLEWLLENRPELLLAFFFGLVLSSAIVISRRVEEWKLGRFIALVVGGVGAYIIVGLVPAQTPDVWWFYILSGAIAICAMILPGISGAFILLLLGKYQSVLSAVGDRDIVTLGLVAIGAGFGILTFAQVLGWLFKRYHDLTVAFIIGLMFGSLRKIWPWKEVVDSRIIDGEEVILRELNLIPDLTPETFFAIGLAAIAFVLVFVLERVAAQGEARAEAETEAEKPEAAPAK